MSLRSRRCLQLLLPMIAVMCLSAAPQQQLNPTVKVLPAATSTVPPECEEGLAPQARPRVSAEEKIVARQITAPPELQAPPSNDLRTTLRDVQTAAERNDRASFVDALARVKTILATYPSGAERTAAEKAVVVYNDLNTLWDYQLTPPGAFFDASSDLFKMLSAYPGYDTFIRRQLLVDQAGSKFYPSSESRAFLTQLAAARIKDLGIKTASAPAATPAAAAAHRPAAAAHEKTPVVHEKATTAQTTAATPAPHKRHARAATKTEHAATASVAKKKNVHVAEAASPAPKKTVEATTTQKSTTTEKAPVATKTSAPETKPASSTSTAVAHVQQPSPAPVTPSPATQTASVTPAPATASVPPAPVPPSDTAASSTTATTSTATTSTVTATDSTATAATADTASTDTTGTAEKEPQGRPGEPRNLLWPIILIVVGVGVLILLFRTSPGPK